MEKGRERNTESKRVRGYELPSLSFVGLFLPKMIVRASTYIYSAISPLLAVRSLW